MRCCNLALLQSAVVLLAACSDDSVAPPIVLSVEATPETATFTALEESHQFSAVAKDANGHELQGVEFDWSTSHGDVATADGTGLVTAVGNGSATISAASEGISGSAEVVVRQAVTSIVVTPAADTLMGMGDYRWLSAAASDRNGHIATDVMS